MLHNPWSGAVVGVAERLSCFARIGTRYSSPGVCIWVDPVKLHPDSRTALLTTGERHSVEPAYLPTDFLFEERFDSRATFYWYASSGEGIRADCAPPYGWAVVLPT